MENFVVLNNGVKMPRLGFGTDYLKGDECIKSVICAIENGYRLIDTAHLYRNEKEIGIAIKDCIKRGIVKREELFIITKTPYHIPGYKETIDGFNESINNFGLDYIDCLLIHQPFWENINWREHVINTYRALEALYKEGKIRTIGVANFYNINFIDRIQKIYPQIHQFECHPQRQYKKIIQNTKELNIQPMSWGTLNQGFLFESDIIKNIAKKYNKTEAQIAIRWNLQLGGGVALVRSSKPERIKENFDVWDFELTQEDKEQIDKLDGKGRGHWEDECGFSSLPIGNLPIKDYNRLIVNLLKNNLSYTKNFKLFNFIPFLKKHKVSNRITKWYLFGMPFLKIDTKISYNEDKND